MATSKSPFASAPSFVWPDGSEAAAQPSGEELPAPEDAGLSHAEKSQANWEALQAGLARGDKPGDPNNIGWTGEEEAEWLRKDALRAEDEAARVARVAARPVEAPTPRSREWTQADIEALGVAGITSPQETDRMKRKAADSAISRVMEAATAGESVDAEKIARLANKGLGTALSNLFVFAVEESLFRPGQFDAIVVPKSIWEREGSGFEKHLPLEALLPEGSVDQILSDPQWEGAAGVWRISSPLASDPVGLAFDLIGRGFEFSRSLQSVFDSGSRGLAPLLSHMDGLDAASTRVSGAESGRLADWRAHKAETDPVKIARVQRALSAAFADDDEHDRKNQEDSLTLGRILTEGLSTAFCNQLGYFLVFHDEVNCWTASFSPLGWFAEHGELYDRELYLQDFLPADAHNLEESNFWMIEGVSRNPVSLALKLSSLGFVFDEGAQRALSPESLPAMAPLFEAEALAALAAQAKPSHSGSAAPDSALGADSTPRDGKPAARI